MTDVQLLTLAIAMIVPLALLLYSNSRITEAKETLRADIATLRVDIKRLEEKIDAHFEHMELRFKLHEYEHHGKKPE